MTRRGAHNDNATVESAILHGDEPVEAIALVLAQGEAGAEEEGDSHRVALLRHHLLRPPLGTRHSQACLQLALVVGVLGQQRRQVCLLRLFWLLWLLRCCCHLALPLALTLVACRGRCSGGGSGPCALAFDTGARSGAAGVAEGGANDLLCLCHQTLNPRPLAPTALARRCAPTGCAATIVSLGVRNHAVHGPQLLQRHLCFSQQRALLGCGGSAAAASLLLL